MMNEQEMAPYFKVVDQFLANAVSYPDQVRELAAMFSSDQKVSGYNLMVTINSLMADENGTNHENCET